VPARKPPQGVEQGAGTQQIQALSVQSLDSSIANLDPRRETPLAMLPSENSVFFTGRVGRSSFAEKKGEAASRQCW